MLGDPVTMRDPASQPTKEEVIMEEKPRWWQFNRKKFSDNVKEAEIFFDDALNGPAGKAPRPNHPDHNPPKQGDFRDSPVAARIRELQDLLAQGHITPQDFEARKKEILREV